MRASFLSIIVLFSSLFFVNAMPTRRDGDEDGGCALEAFDLQTREFDDLERRALKATAEAAIALLKTVGGATKFIFYSGHTGKHKAYVAATALAKSKQMKTIPMFLRENKISTAGWGRADWSATCRTAGEVAAGDPPAVLGEVVSNKSVWIKDEFPALKANTKVKTVPEYSVSSSGAATATGKDLKGGSRSPSPAPGSRPTSPNGTKKK